jgi:hypothetical protein
MRTFLSLEISHGNSLMTASPKMQASEGECRAYPTVTSAHRSTLQPQASSPTQPHESAAPPQLRGRIVSNAS